MDEPPPPETSVPSGCPRCGDEPLVVSTSRQNSPLYDHTVRCDRCGRSGPTFPSRRGAVAFWNLMDRGSQPT